MFEGGVYGYTPRLLRPKGSIGKTRPQEALPRAPTCSNSITTRWQHARRPCRARTCFCFFFRHVCEANGTAAQEGSQGFPLLTLCWGGMPRHLNYIYVVAPDDHYFPLLDRVNIPSWPPMTAPEAGINTYRRYDPTARTAKERNIQQLRVVAIVFRQKIQHNK